MYFISDDKSLLQIDQIQSMLNRCYWAEKRSRETIELSVSNSLCFGAYLCSTGEQVAFARVISDFASTWYLCDVVVREDYRGRGIGTELVGRIVGDDRLRNLRGILASRDAKSMYEKHGFRHNPDIFMERKPTL